MTLLVFTARAVLATAIPSVRLSVRPSVRPSHAGNVSKRRSDSKMCLVLYRPKNIRQGRPLPPEILATSDLPSPDSSES